MKPTKEEMKLASPCYNAIKAIAGERECDKCNGRGRIKYVPTSTDPAAATITCPTCKGVGKVGWKWEPEQNDLVLFKDVITSYQGSQENGSYLVLRPKDKYDIVVPKKDCIPILPWREIKRILEGMGYIVKVRDQEGFGKECKYNCGIYTDKLGVGASAPTCQEAVMLAVDRLRKEIKK